MSSRVLNICNDVYKQNYNNIYKQIIILSTFMYTFVPVLLDYFVYMRVSNNIIISEVLDPYLTPSKM